jgi:general secretion pathway protein K
MRAKSVRGGVLLAVLWLSAALAAIAFSLANTVRGETERTSTAVDGLRSYYLATASVQRGILYMDWARLHPENAHFKPTGTSYAFQFPTGQGVVEIIPETAKFNLNTSPAEDLFRLLLNLGVDAGRSQQIVAAIVDWRGGAGASPASAVHQSMMQPMGPPHAPFAEVEELLAVRGVTPDIFYGSWEHAPEGSAQRLYQRTGLRDCVSIFGATDQFDVNTAPSAVLAAIGIPPAVVTTLVQQRRTRAFLTAGDLAPFAQSGGPGFGRLRIGGNSIFTLRATARLRLPNGQLSDLRRTVAAQVKMMPAGYDTSYHILRWYDNATAPEF